MPSSWKRISVVSDPELSTALQSVAPYYPDTPAARVVHDLAIKGAEVVAEERRRHDEAIEWLVAFSTGQGDAIDWDVLERIDQLAWRD